MFALQKSAIELAKKQEAVECEEDGCDDQEDFNIPSSVPQPAEPQWVPLSLANQGPAAVALKLLTDADCTEEQIDAVALMALAMQNRFEARPDKSTILLPVAASSNNHRSLWLGGGDHHKSSQGNVGGSTPPYFRHAPWGGNVPEGSRHVGGGTSPKK